MESMNQQQASHIRDRARMLLGQWRAECFEHAADLEHLLAEGVSQSTAADLYPYALTEWEAGYRRLIERDRQQSLTHTTKRLLSLPNWKLARVLARALRPTSPYITEADRTLYERYSDSSFNGAAVSGKLAHLNLFGMLLHVLATSPDAEGMLSEPKVQDHAERLCDLTEWVLSGEGPQAAQESAGD